MFNGSNQPNYPGGSQPPNQQQQQNRVKVEDALSYLEEVKNEFHLRPEVYTQFLDIMKDFKSQAIDTPGVIERVSSLFNEYPRLILGFNAFLPPGYQVRYISNRICVINPNNEFQEIGQPGMFQNIETNGYGADGAGGGEDEMNEDEEEEVGDEMEYEDEDEEEDQGEGYQEQVYEVQNYAMEEDSYEDEEFTEDEMVGEEDDDSDEDEEEEEDDNESESEYEEGASIFIHRVRMRFGEESTTYKQFLDILYFCCRDNSEHQDESTSSQKGLFNLKEEEKRHFVTMALTNLFADQSDLIEDFLAIVSTPGGVGRGYVVSSRGSELDTPDENEENDIKQEVDDDDQDEDVEKEKEKKARKKLARKRRRIDRKMSHDEDESVLRRVYHLIHTNEAKLYSRLQESLDVEDIKKVLLLFNIYLSKNITRLDLVRALRDVLNLRCTPIFSDFCEILGFNTDLNEPDRLPIIEPSTSSPNKSVYPSRRAFTRDGDQISRDINESTIACLGVSYRHIYRAEKVKCSGRTQLCDEVLNDEWTSYPSWSSEDNGNVSSKKSPYEEFLYRTEDERFELDIVLDVNKYAIESLELINRRMDKMGEHERNSFKLDKGYNVTSVCLLTRAIRRIYGEAASTIMTGLRENPVIAVPRILQRCQEKEREWRESQTQMNKMWREQLEKQLQRSLDHQTAQVKQNDARLLKTKTMIHQIEQFFDTRQGKDPKHDHGPHIAFTYPERRKILHDVNDIIIHYLKRQPGYSKDDKRRMKIVMRKIILEWFCEKHEDMSDDERDEELDFDKKRNRREGSSNRDDQLEYNKKGERINLINYYADDHTDEWPIEMKYETTDDAPINEYLKRQKMADYRLFFGDDSLYIFMRLHHTICDRFGRFHAAYKRKCDDFHDSKIGKQLWESEFAKATNKLLTKVERDWGAMDEKLSILRKSRHSPATLYITMLNDLKRYLNGELDASAYEETLRSTFPHEACLLLSIDKLLMLTVKTLSTLANNEDECGAMKMYMRYRLRQPPTLFATGDFVETVEREYSALAEERLHGKNCFKFEMINEHGGHSMHVTLVDTEDSDREEEEEEQEEEEEEDDENVAASTASGDVESISGEKPSTSASVTSEKEENPCQELLSNEGEEEAPQIEPENEPQEEKEPSVSSGPSRRFLSQGKTVENPRLQLHLNRNTRYLNPRQMRVFNYSLFAKRPNNLATNHRGGFLVVKASRKRQNVINNLRRMNEIRNKRCKIVQINSSEKCDVLELDSTKTTNNQYPNADFQFLNFNLYKSV